ncbi:MAG: beta-1,6-glucan synthase [Zoogloeaceae bacterium]|jgi:glucan 1,3-beta-glucosidase|nr:beta-1,6-glucan synthase [Zoogloeaceae bacterium]
MRNVLPFDVFFLRLGLCGLCLAGALLFFWQTRPVTPPDFVLSATHKLRCLSYAPYHQPGQTPFDKHLRIPPAQIEADLKALSAITGCVRTYGLDQGLDAVPEIAQKLGLKVLLGAWISNELPRNRAELDRAITLANRYPQTVRAVIVGNEVMLRRELSASALLGYLQEARARITPAVAITYAEVWAFWEKFPQLAQGVDFVSAHFLPYWEDRPLAADAAVDDIEIIRARLLAQFKKPVLIAEAGWPSAGHDRGPARPGLREEATFIRTFLAQAEAKDWDYNLIEAIDQPWKRQLEGTAGGHWGLLSADDLALKFPLAGPVVERPVSDWGGLLGAMLLGALLLALRCRAHWRVALPVGLWLGMALFLGFEHARLAWRDLWEWGTLGAVAALGVWLLCRPLGLNPPDNRWARTLFCVAAAIAAMLLMVDGRYRDFPLALYALPLPMLLACRQRDPRVWLPGLVAFAAALTTALGDPQNRQAWAWAALCGLLLLSGCLKARKA